MTLIYLKSAMFFPRKVTQACKGCTKSLNKSFSPEFGCQRMPRALTPASPLTQHVLIQLLSGHYCFPFAVSVFSLILSARKVLVLLTCAQAEVGPKLALAFYAECTV